jgi:hypothetical protein
MRAKLLSRNLRIAREYRSFVTFGTFGIRTYGLRLRARRLRFQLSRAAYDWHTRDYSN